MRGIVASGHPQTSAAAAEVLRAGGNAFDAALAGLAAACVAEPLLTSLGGGGYLLACPAGGRPRVYDFFAHTPGRRRPSEELQFHAIEADFGTATQEFHIGMGSIAVPGVLAGLEHVSDELGHMPLAEVLAPAIALARDGVEVNPFQSYVAGVLEPIVRARPEALAVVAAPDRPAELPRAGDRLFQPEMADALAALADEGSGLFYRGELAARLARDCAEHGGHLDVSDLAEYRVERREPVQLAGSDWRLFINSPPAPGGCLVAFALGLLENRDLGAWGGPAHALAVARAMAATNRLRRDLERSGPLTLERAEAVLGAEQLARWRAAFVPHSEARRGTTHISVVDGSGNLASLTSSNGEGSAYVWPGTGIMLNNMLGEEDLNPGGFHRWPPGTRLASMMAPAVLHHGDGAVALGSGGSNRIRSAILQVLLDLVAWRMDLTAAVEAPRMHLEGRRLSVEAGFSPAAVEAMQSLFAEFEPWPEPNLFFGGVHAVRRHRDGRLEGAGDPRRAGAVSFA